MIERTTKEIVIQSMTLKAMSENHLANQSKEDFNNNLDNQVWVLRSEHDEELVRIKKEILIELNKVNDEEGAIDERAYYYLKDKIDDVFGGERK